MDLDARCVNSGASNIILIALTLLAFIDIHPLTAEEFRLPVKASDSVVGEVLATTARREDTLIDIARAFDLGHDQIILANPRINRWLPRPGSRVTIPSLYILPPGKREGIILNLAELRLYYYPPGAHSVHTYPVSIGDIDWRTPLGSTTITGKVRNPSWTPPASIRREHLEDGEDLPPYVPGGSPDNPLGRYALYLARKGYLIHGTDERRAFGIGMRVSHGCIRLYPEDIEVLFEAVRVGTPVRIIDEPIKVGWRNDQLFLEVHRPLLAEEQEAQKEPDIDAVISLISGSVTERDRIDASEVHQAFLSGDGIPVVIAKHPISPYGWDALGLERRTPWTED